MKAFLENCTVRNNWIFYLHILRQLFNAHFSVNVLFSTTKKNKANLYTTHFNVTKSLINIINYYSLKAFYCEKTPSKFNLYKNCTKWLSLSLRYRFVLIIQYWIAQKWKIFVMNSPTQSESIDKIPHFHVIAVVLTARFTMISETSCSLALHWHKKPIISIPAVCAATCLYKYSIHQWISATTLLIDMLRAIHVSALSVNGASL